MVNEQSFSERLEFIISHYELSAAVLADILGVQRSSISHLLSGRNNPSLDFIVKILDNYPELNFNWLVKGSGKVFNNIDIKEPVKTVTSTPTLFDQEFENDKVTPKKIEEVKQESNSSVIELNKKIKPIDKILVLYQDGSFDSYI